MALSLVQDEGAAQADELNELSAAPTRTSSDMRPGLKPTERRVSASSPVDGPRLTAALSAIMSAGERTPRSRYSVERTCELTSAERADLHTLFKLLLSRCRSATLFAGPRSLTEPEPEPKPEDLIISRAEFQIALCSGTNSALIHRIFDMLASGEGIDFEGFAEGLAPLVAADATLHDRLCFLFDACDLDGSGYISRDELFVLLHQIDVLPPEFIEPAVDMTMDQLDKDGDGVISWVEFETHYGARPAALHRLTEQLGLSVNRLTARLIMSLDAVGLTPPHETKLPGSTSKVLTVLAAPKAVDPKRDASIRRSNLDRRASMDAPRAMRVGAPPPAPWRDTSLFDGPRDCPSPPRPACVLQARMNGGIKVVDTHRPPRTRFAAAADEPPRTPATAETTSRMSRFTGRGRFRASARDEAKARAAAERLKYDRALADRAAAERIKALSGRVRDDGLSNEHSDAQDQHVSDAPRAEKTVGWAAFSSFSSLHTTTCRRTDRTTEQTERTERERSDARSAGLFSSSVRSFSRPSSGKSLARSESITE